MSKAKAVLQGLLLVAGIWLCCEGALTLRYARQRSVYTFDKLNTVLRESSQTMDELRKGATTWNQASKDQSSQTTQVLSHANAVLSQLSTFVTSTDKSLNATLLPAATSAINQQNAALLLNQEKLTGNLSTSQKILSDSDKLITDLAPKVEESVDSLREAAQNTANATGDGAASMKDVRVALDYELKQLMAPVTKIKAAGLIALTVLRKLYF